MLVKSHLGITVMVMTLSVIFLTLGAHFSDVGFSLLGIIFLLLGIFLSVAHAYILYSEMRRNYKAYRRFEYQF